MTEFSCKCAKCGATLVWSHGKLICPNCLRNDLSNPVTKPVKG